MMNPEIPKVRQIARQRFKRVTDARWKVFAEQGEIVLDMFRQPGAKSLVKTGDGEEQILEQQHPIAPQLVEAIKHADCLGLRGAGLTEPENPRNVTKSIIRSLKKYHQVEVDNHMQIDAVLFSRMPELVGRLAAGRRVLWITSDADVIVKNLNNPAFRSFYGLHDIANNDWINAAEPEGNSPFPKYISAEKAFADIQQRLPEKDFDLALVGAGVTGKLACHYIKTSLGKSAVDIGVCMSYFRGSRERNDLRPDGKPDFGKHFLVWDPTAN